MRKRAPDFDIAPILEELGAVDVPRVTGHGHARMRCFNPEHDDATPSASVSRYGFTCWGCGLKGDAISLIRKMEGAGYADAVARCREIVGSPDHRSREEPPERPRLSLLTGD